jgi:hypothetical protein
MSSGSCRIAVEIAPDILSLRSSEFHTNSLTLHSVVVRCVSFEQTSCG